MKTKLLFLAVLLLAGLCACSSSEKNALLSLHFDEGKGTTISDASNHLPDTEINYAFTHAVFTENKEPLWRSDGIKNGCLLFDGSSTYISYSKNDIMIDENTLSISVWIAPRTFEWDDPNAADCGTDSLTGIVSQSDKKENKGFILGYERFGRLSFQVGTGDEWLSIWSNGDNLEKYKWNYITATFDAPKEEMKLYLNGELVASGSVPSGASIAPAKSKNLIIGRNGEGERLAAGFLNVCSGYMDELTITTEIPTEKEIKKSYEKASPKEIAFDDIWLQNILTDDYTRTQYHAAPYQFWMNEPHAPMYYNGMYHLFFQENMTGAYWRNICWGHLVSTDMVNWVPIKEAITPTENSVVPDGVWSGNAAYDINGVPLLFFTAGNDSFYKDELISNQNIGVAYPSDLSDPNLTDWTVYDKLAVEQKKGEGRSGEFRDPSIMKIGDIWYMFICSGSTKTSGGCVLLYTTDTLELLEDGFIDMNWIYQGVVYEMENPSKLYGTSWELPIMLPISNTQGTISKFLFIFSPAPASIADNKIYYYLGDFDTATGKFTPDETFTEPRILDYGANVFTGPSAFIDPVTNDIILFSIMQDQRSAANQGASGWAHSAGLARKLWLSDDGLDVKMSVIDSVQTLENEPLIDAQNLTINDANDLLKDISEDMYIMKLTLDISECEEFQIHLKQGGKWDNTTYRYDCQSKMLYGETENKGEGAATGYVSGELLVDNDILDIEIYVDRSLVEAFFQDTKSLSIRSYTEEVTSTGISLECTGNLTIQKLTLSPMKSIF